jgi:hypothetical protein
MALCARTSAQKGVGGLGVGGLIVCDSVLFQSTDGYNAPFKTEKLKTTCPNLFSTYHCTVIHAGPTDQRGDCTIL